MIAADLVISVRNDNQREGRFDPATDEPDEVERRLVGPVQVVQQDDTPFRRAESAEKTPHDIDPRGASIDEPRQLAVEVGGYLDDRSERLRRRQRIASAERGACP